MASTAQAFEDSFVDSEVDVLVAESMLNGDLVDTLTRLRSSGCGCGVVWVHDPPRETEEGFNYAHFADRRIDQDTPWFELHAMLGSLHAMLQRYGWR